MSIAPPPTAATLDDLYRVEGARPNSLREEGSCSSMPSGFQYGRVAGFISIRSF